MNTPRSLRRLAVAALLLGAVGIAMLWAGGVKFPVAVPPGIVILVAGAAVVALLRAPWVPVVGTALGLFVLVGFLLSPTGWVNLSGGHGGLVAAGQAVQLVGVLVAAVAGVLATRAGYRDRSGASAPELSSRSTPAPRAEGHG
jgi:hypothetical protein